MQKDFPGFFEIDPPPGGPARLRTAIGTGGTDSRWLTLPITGSRAGNRVVLLGAVAALAAVATILVSLRRPPVLTLTYSATPIMEAETASSAIDPISKEPTTGVLPAVTEVTSPPRMLTVRVAPPEIETDAQLDALDLPDETRELVREEHHAVIGDPARYRAAQDALHSLHSALIEELRKVPGLMVVASDPEEVSLPSRHYRLEAKYVASPFAPRPLVLKDIRYTPVRLDVEQLQPGGKSIFRLNAAATIDAQAACSAAPVVDASCADARGTAVMMVRKLLQEIFAETALTQEWQSKLRDSSRSPSERLKTLADFLRLQANTGDASLLRDPNVVRGVIDLAAATTDPVLRAQIWRSMRGVGHTSLVEPLIASLAQDPTEVRLAAAEILGADFLGDPRVRSALEMTAAVDARALVRAVAERGLSGEEGWRQYVVTSLKDANLPASQRVEALMHYLYPPRRVYEPLVSHPEYWQNMKELLDDGNLRALAEVLPKLGRLGTNEGNLVSNMAGQFDKSPAVTRMLLDYLEHDALPRNRRIAGFALARTRVGEPRVRVALNKALTSDPDQSVRDEIRQAMLSSP